MNEISPLYNVHPLGKDGEIKPTCAGPFRSLELAKAVAKELHWYTTGTHYIVVETVKGIVFTFPEENDD